MSFRPTVTRYRGVAMPSHGQRPRELVTTSELQFRNGTSIAQTLTDLRRFRYEQSQSALNPWPRVPRDTYKKYRVINGFIAELLSTVSAVASPYRFCLHISQKAVKHDDIEVKNTPFTNSRS